MSRKPAKVSAKSRNETKLVSSDDAQENPSPLTFDWRTAEIEPLSIELRTYQRALDQLLFQKNDYVLIKGQEVVGTYPTRELAVSQAIDRFGAEPVLIKQIVEIEPVLEIGHIEL